MSQPQDDIEATGMTDEGAANEASLPQSEPPLYPAPEETAPVLDVDFLAIKNEIAANGEVTESEVTESEVAGEERVAEFEAEIESAPTPTAVQELQASSQTVVEEPSATVVENTQPALAAITVSPVSAADKTRRIVMTLAAILCGVLALRFLARPLIPFAAAFLIAYLVSPITRFFESLLHGRKLAVIATWVVMLGVGYGGYRITQLSVLQTTAFINSLDNVWQDIQSSAAQQKVEFRQTDFGKTHTGWTEFVAAWNKYLDARDKKTRDANMADFRRDISGTYMGTLVDGNVVFVQRRLFNQTLARFMNRIGENGLAVAGAFAATLGVLAVVIIVVLYMVLITFNLPTYTSFWRTLIPPQTLASINHLFAEFDSAMRQYFVRQAIAAVITAGIFAFGFAYVGIQLSLPMALALGFLGMVPYLQVVGLAPALMLALYRSVDQQVAFLPTLTQLLLLFAVVIAIQELLLKPIVVGRGETMERLAILLGIFLWPQLLGLGLGALLAIPITCLAIAWYRIQREKQAQLAATESVGEQPMMGVSPTIAYATVTEESSNTTAS